MDIAQPLVIVGTGRCGSTLLHRLLVRHPDVGYLTPLCVRWPSRPWINRAAMASIGRVSVLQRVPGLRRALRPSEAFPFWELYAPGFSQPFRDLGADDLYAPHAERLRAALEGAFSRRRPRVLLKQVGWPRLGYLDALLPDARFVHVRRDGRAVANSFLNVPWWRGWHGPARWRWGELTPDQDARWRAADRSFVALAVLSWEILMDAQELASKNIPTERYLDVTYEDLCSQTPDIVGRVAEFAGLRMTDRFRREVERAEVRDANAAWRSQLTQRQQDVLLRTIEPALARHGYA